MDFFEAQARAKRRTSRLIVLFALAVLGIVAVGYLTAVLLLREAGQLETPSLWQPELFALIALGTGAVVGLAAAGKWISFRRGGRAVAESVGGRRLDPHTTDLAERRLLNVVEEMALASGVPLPAVYVLDREPGINAFAAGLTTSDAVVAVTRGALEQLSRDELQGVIAHEFSHILNGDMRLNVKLAALLFGILVIGLLGRGLIWSLRYTRVRSSGNNRNSGGILVALFVAGLALFLIGYIGYFFGRLIQAAVSRQREFLADASAVQFTRNPPGIAGALKKIGGYAAGSSLQARQSTAIGHFFFAQGFRSSLGGLWATHPPLTERIRAIEPGFDGRFSPAPPAPSSPASGPRPPSPARPGPRPPPPAPTATPLATALAGLGTLEPRHVAEAQTLLAQLPARLHEAAHRPEEVAALLYGLVLSDDPALARQQRALLPATGEASSLEALQPALAQLRPEHKLPLVQLALPVVAGLPAETADRLTRTLDALIHADRQVSPFEYALQKVLRHHLAIAREPARGPGERIYSFDTVAPDLSVVLSTLARVGARSEDAAERAFLAGAGQLPLAAGPLRLRPAAECTLDHLDASLDRLADASLPIKRRLLTAAAEVIESDHRSESAELELLRAIAAVLDCPLPAGRMEPL